MTAFAELDTAELLGRLYESAMTPESLNAAMADAGRWLEVDATHLIGWDTSRFVPRVAVVNEGAMDHVDPAYVEHYCHVDPRRARMAEVPMGEVATCSRFFSEAFVSQDAFFQEFLIPRGRRHTMGAHLYRDAQFDFYVSCYHAVGRESFTSRQIEKAQWLVPHLQRMTRLMLRCGAAELGERALDGLDHGVVLMDGLGEVLFSNRRAQAVLRGGRWLVEHRRRLRSVVGSPAMVADMVARVTATGIPDSRVLRRPPESSGDAAWCSLTVTRLSTDTERAWAALVPHAALLMLIDVPHEQRRVTAAQLMQMFGLTQAEARLAHALVQGMTVEGYATSTGVAMPTVRSQVRSLLDKTDTQRQQEMVRLLATLPSARAPVGT